MGKTASLIKILKSGAVTVPKDICTLMNLSPGEKFYIWLDSNDLINLSKKAPERIAAEKTAFTKARHIKLPSTFIKATTEVTK